MKKCAIVILFALVPLSVFAGTNGVLENQTSHKSGDLTPQLDVSVQGPIKGKWGWSFWGLATQTWSEALVGVTYSPSKNLNLGFSYGVEDDKKPGRLASSLWASRGNVSLLVLHENGGSGAWHKIVLNYKTGRFGMGIMDQASFIGPRGEVSFGKTKVWGAALFRSGERKQIMGIARSF